MYMTYHFNKKLASSQIKYNKIKDLTIVIDYLIVNE